MLRFSLFVAGIALLSLMGAQLGHGQSTGQDAGSGSPQVRRDELAKVQEALADPDPLQRLANMEAIVNSDDALKIQIALRTAFSSDDDQLRGLGMRAYIASLKQLAFDVNLPDNVKRQFDAAQGDESKIRELGKKYNYLMYLNLGAFSFFLNFHEFDLMSSSGNLDAGGSSQSPFTISGDRLLTTAPVVFGSYAPKCTIEFSPKQTLLFEGTLACSGGWPRLMIAAPIF